jgi:PAS domain S-box-containing protein
MGHIGEPSARDWNEDAALRAILQGTASATGESFFRALVENLGRALNTYGSWVTEYLEESHRLRALAFWMDGGWVDDYEIDITGTPCERVIEHARLVHFPDRLLDLFPHDPEIIAGRMMSYLGVPLLDVNGKILGHMAVIDRRPMPAEPRTLALFQIFAARAAAELQRLRAEAEVREREERLSRVVGSAMDAIIELDDAFRVTLLNPAGEKAFSCRAPEVNGRDFTTFLSEQAAGKLRELAAQLNVEPDGACCLWIPGGLEARRPDGKPFQAEATLARVDRDRRKFYTLILRDVNERLEAERRIRSLTVEAEYLRQEIRERHNFDLILGQSESLGRVLQDVRQVAPLNTTVLIQGETGTGKELFARAIHQASARRKEPFIKVNCAAIPANLIESEFFGHEKGAFTGATTRREGRFALADGGTIFLDEVGELPLELQSKLLRVLQEGEFDSVGSSRTRKVDVRVIAATNRKLGDEVKAGRFREDLYYRLNVFPIDVPPLRERGEDIPLLAAAFSRRFAQRMGRVLDPLSPECERRLRAYSWPGNVRELENVIERAVITAEGRRLNLDRALPVVPELRESSSSPCENAAAPTAEKPAIRTVKEMEELERQNLIRALESCDWRVAGASGAAQLLGMNPSTFNSRMKALGIHRPRPERV